MNLANLVHSELNAQSPPPMSSLAVPIRPPPDELRLVLVKPDGTHVLEYLTPERTFSSPPEFLQHLLLDVEMQQGILIGLHTFFRPQGTRAVIYHEVFKYVNMIQIVPPFEEDNLCRVLTRMLHLPLPTPLPIPSHEPSPNPIPSHEPSLNPIPDAPFTALVDPPSIEIRTPASPFTTLMDLPSVELHTPDRHFQTPAKFFRCLQNHASLRQGLLKTIREAADNTAKRVIVTHYSIPLPLIFHTPVTDEVFLDFLRDAEKFYERDNVLICHVKTYTLCPRHTVCPPSCSYFFQ